MKKNKNKEWIKMLFGIVIIVSLIGLIIATIIGIIYRFKNPTLTDTQLFIWYFKKFWGWYVVFMGGYLGLKIFS